jgi:hypothetical protein
MILSKRRRTYCVAWEFSSCRSSNLYFEACNLARTSLSGRQVLANQSFMHTVNPAQYHAAYAITFKHNTSNLSPLTSSRVCNFVHILKFTLLIYGRSCTETVKWKCYIWKTQPNKVSQYGIIPKWPNRPFTKMQQQYYCQYASNSSRKLYFIGIIMLLLNYISSNYETVTFIHSTIDSIFIQYFW